MQPINQPVKMFNWAFLIVFLQFLYLINGQLLLPGGCQPPVANSNFNCTNGVCSCTISCCECNTATNCTGNNVTCSNLCSNEGIHCTNASSCAFSTFICNDPQGCNYLCEDYRSCAGATFIVPTGTSATIGCIGERSCFKMQAYLSSKSIVNCTGAEACRSSIVDFNFGDPVDDYEFIDRSRVDQLNCFNNASCKSSNVTMNTGGTVNIIGGNASNAVAGIYGRCLPGTRCTISGQGANMSAILFDRGAICLNDSCVPTFDPDEEVELAPSETFVIANIEEFLLFEEFRTVEGTENSPLGFGGTGFEARRSDPREFNYSDVIGNDISGRDRPNPRTITNVLMDQGPIIVNVRRLTNWVWQWGQFIDHDMAEVLFNFTEPLPIPIPPGDPVFSGPEFQQPATQIDFFRSVHISGTGITAARPRNQMHSLTAFIDGSTVYGSEEELEERLRTFEDGLLKSQFARNSQGFFEELLPFDMFQPAPGSDAMRVFLAGDTRSNEQNGLTAVHTLWVREHNRLARVIKREHPDFDDEEIFDYARLIVSAIIQKITFYDWLPLVTGSQLLPGYLMSDYNQNINVNTGASFSTFSYRIGHTMLPEVLQRLDADGNIIPAGNQFLRDSFFNSAAVFRHGVDANLIGLSRGLSYEGDERMTDAVRNFLFINTTFITPLDLAALNIWRGREWGLPDYNTIREIFGLPRVQNISYISNLVETQQRLAILYPNPEDIDRIDGFAGCSAETRLPGSTLGETNTAIWTDQFTRFRNGDRFWYQRQLTGPLLEYIDKTTLRDVILRNSRINSDALQPNVFLQMEGDQVAIRQLRDNPILEVNDLIANQGGVNAIVIGRSRSRNNNNNNSRNEENLMLGSLITLVIIFFFCCLFSVWLFYYVYQAKQKYWTNH